MRKEPVFTVLAALGVALAEGPTASAAEVDFNTQVKPILESACLSCHGKDKPKGDLSFLTKESAFKGGENGVVIVPGQPDKSPLFTTTTLPADDDAVMPPKGDLLTKSQQAVLKDWIAGGAKWPDGVTLTQVQRVSFVKDVQPILEFNCVACHRPDYQKGDLDLTTMASTVAGKALTPFQPGKSSLYTSTTLSADDDNLMPPAAKGGPLDKEKTDLLKNWILQGAPWPDGLVLTPKKAEQSTAGDNLALAVELHKVIAGNQVEKTQGDMKAYTNTIPATYVNYSMVPVPGGEFVMGSPDSEQGRKPDEGPQHKVKIEPFWMGQFEVTWNEYELFMYGMDKSQTASLYTALPELTPMVDAVSRPTKPYVEMSFGMGKDNYPAISMTQHAANKYCQWLSAKTGHFYRLPTEAEWEYACRAGSTTAYFFGDDVSKLKEYAWYEDNSDFQYKKVGKKKPNPWGLYDIHGNVAEWCLDQYDTNYYKLFEGKMAQGPWNPQTKPYGHVVRGGSWDDAPVKLRSSARLFSNPGWKQQDPQLPKSIWYLTDAQFLGLRIIRPLKVPSAEEMFRFWNNGVEKE